MKVNLRNNKFLKFLDFEFEKNSKVLWIAIALFLIPQLLGILFQYIDTITTTHYGFDYSNFISMKFSNIMYMLQPFLLLLGGGLSIVFTLWIWYSEILGRNKTIYSIVMLPANKLYVLASKFIVTLILPVIFFFLFNILNLFVIFIFKFFTNEPLINSYFTNFTNNSGFDAITIGIIILIAIVVINNLFMFCIASIIAPIKGSIFSLIYFVIQGFIGMYIFTRFEIGLYSYVVVWCVSLILIATILNIYLITKKFYIGG